MLQQVIEIHELLDSAHANGAEVVDFFQKQGLENISCTTVSGKEGKTDFLKLVLEGSEGKTAEGSTPTLGIIGQLGGVGARPEQIGLVSDADGAIAALACALKVVQMKAKGDILKGDVIITTHICADAPVIPHDPVPFMGSPIDMATTNQNTVDQEMDAILSIDTTKGNHVVNHCGFAITPTVKEGYILPVSKSLLDILSWTTGKNTVVVPLSTQDITPYGNGLTHVNSILQPATATTAPVVGVAITAETAVPGSGTGASREVDIEAAARFCMEVAKSFTNKSCSFFDEKEFKHLVKLYGSMDIFQTKGK